MRQHEIDKVKEGIAKGHLKLLPACDCQLGEHEICVHMVKRDGCIVDITLEVQDESL